MKKLIAILVVFALVAGSAFAQADFSAGGAISATLIEGNFDDDPTVSFDQWFWFSAGKTNEDGTMGAKGSISFSGLNVGNRQSITSSTGDSWFYAWWQPIDQLFIKFGKVGQDGKYWAGAGVMGWDFQSNDLMIDPGYNYYNGMPGGIFGDGYGYFDAQNSDYNGLQISILPFDGFALNLGWSLIDNGDAPLDVYINNIAIQAVYDIAGLGKAALGFTFNKTTGQMPNYNWATLDSIRMQFALQYGMGIGDGMKIELGVKTYLNNVSGNMYGTPIDDTFMDPLQIGIGFGYGSAWGDDFWLTARLAAGIPMADGQDMKFGLQLCVSYDLGIFRIYVPAGITIQMTEQGHYGPDDAGATYIGWGFSPYIRKDLGGMELWAGFMLWNGNGSYWNESSLGYDYPNDPPVLGTGVLGMEQINYAFRVAFLWAW